MHTSGGGRAGSHLCVHAQPELAVSVQVCIPVEVAGQAVTSVSMLSLHKTDKRLLQTAAKLGPLMAEAAQAVGEALKEEEAQEAEASTSGQPQLDCMLTV